MSLECNLQALQKLQAAKDAAAQWQWTDARTEAEVAEALETVAIMLMKCTKANLYLYNMTVHRI